MKNKEPRPRWGWLYAIFGLMLALFYLESKMLLGSGVRPWAQLGILGLVVMLTEFWIGSNMPFDPWS